MNGKMAARSTVGMPIVLPKETPILPWEHAILKKLGNSKTCHQSVLVQNVVPLLSILRLASTWIVGAVNTSSVLSVCQITQAIEGTLVELLQDKFLLNLALNKKNGVEIVLRNLQNKNWFLNILYVLFNNNYII